MNDIQVQASSSPATASTNGHVPSIREVDIGPLDPARANRTYRIWVTRHPIAGALLGGFVAVHIATIFGYFMGGIGLPQLNWPLVNGNVILPKASDPVKFVMGEVFIHGLDGVMFTLIYAIALFPFLTLLMRGNLSATANMAKGVIFGVLLATISIGFLTPYVYAPHSGAGLFTTGFGWKLMLGIYLFHVAFGANVGLMYNPIRMRGRDASTPVATTASVELRSADRPAV